MLDFSALEPGRRPSDAIRKAAADLHSAERFRRARAADRPGADGRRGVLHACRKARGRNIIGTVVIVLVILWLALKSKRIILAVFINLFAGLAITAALGLLMVGALNMISVAFAVLFVGLGVDFAHPVLRCAIAPNATSVPT